VLALIASHHIHGLLQQIEVELSVLGDVRSTEVSVNEVLSPCVKEGVDVRLVPTGLFDGLKLAVQIVQPLADVSLIGL